MRPEFLIYMKKQTSTGVCFLLCYLFISISKNRMCPSLASRAC